MARRGLSAARRLGLQATTNFNLGRPGDLRVPDGGLIPWPAGIWHDTAVLVVEILSPDDESLFSQLLAAHP